MVEQRTCSRCQQVWHIERQELTFSNGGVLNCPKCGTELVAWHGHFYYTLANFPAKSEERNRSASM
jgi:hypothetical protein